jgi:hypothetical protein
MRRVTVPVVASVLIVAGALGMAAGQVAALATGQFARWDRLVEERHLRFASAHPGGGPSVPLHTPFSAVCRCCFRPGVPGSPSGACGTRSRGSVPGVPGG